MNQWIYSTRIPESGRWDSTRRSSWYYGFWPALVMAAIQLFMTLNDSDTFFGVAIIFFAYWIVLTFWIWFFRAVRDRWFHKRL
jgi:hypothetical protein